MAQIGTTAITVNADDTDMVTTITEPNAGVEASSEEANTAASCGADAGLVE
ncbi:hypothetical protein TSMEX_008491 [Taenia solium]|eukprot:TsM_000388100 transcript=TsM_000388100 gene=TsM_000388100